MLGRRHIRRNYAVIAVLTVLGLLCAGYVLVHQGGGLPNPWSNVYRVKVELKAANGVVAGIGQPVNVAGVDVGSVVGADLNERGNAVVTLEIERDQLPHVYEDAHALLDPITPLSDMRIELDPGAPPARALSDGATLPVARTAVPVDLADILQALDGDTRAFLASLIDSLGEGTEGQGANLRRALVNLGPTAGQVRSISTALAARRRPLARLVHNLAEVSHAATRDGELGAVVQAGDRTLSAVAAQQAPLRQAIARLPETLRTTRTTLTDASRFADHLRPTVAALLPQVRRLPSTLSTLRPFVSGAASAIERDVRPFVHKAKPVVGELGAATPKLTALAPHVTSSFKTLAYLVNLMAYNSDAIVGGSPDEGGLFWLSWLVHNYNSMFSIADAHGTFGRATIAVSCKSETGILDNEISAVINATVGLSSLCPS